MMYTRRKPGVAEYRNVAHVQTLVPKNTAAMSWHVKPPLADHSPHTSLFHASVLPFKQFDVKITMKMSGRRAVYK